MEISTRPAHPGVSLNSRLLRFCSSTEQLTPGADHTPSENAAPRSQPEPRTQSDASDAAGARERPRQRTPRGKARNPEKLEDIICRMMANRAWTAHLQNSIQALVPEFDHSLVYNVLHGAPNSEHALQFFQWVERPGCSGMTARPT
ncbi:hypothetical protein NL676_009339 [Syzygium grande]|nr:hypothetical protein NL676_009339 [Syzygium grande]